MTGVSGDEGGEKVGAFVCELGYEPALPLTPGRTR